MACFLVTGGAGFIGSHLVHALRNEGHTVRVLDDLSSGHRENVPQEVELIEADVTEPAAVESALDGVHGCFHLAAIASVARSHREWLRTHQVNLTGTINVLDQVRPSRRNREVPVVYASSAAIYGNCGSLPADEESPAAPLSAYGADKHACELHARVAGAIHGVPTVGLRFFNLYGPRQDQLSPYSGVISIFADRLLRGDALEIFGDGEQARDFAFIKRCRLCAAPRYAGSKHQRFRVQCLYRESDKRAVSCTDPGGGVRNRTRRASSSGALQPGADLDRRSPTRFRTARLYCANHALRGSRNNAQLFETYGWVGKGVPT